MQIQSTRTTRSTPLRPGRSPRRWATQAIAGTAVASSLLLGAAPAQALPANYTGATPVTGTDRSFQADNGISLNYHYYADGVDFSQPSGAVFFFDGDGTTRFDQPDSEFIQQMADEAAAENKAFVFVEAPGGTHSWRSGDTDRSAEAVRQFATANILPTVDAPVLLTGYSGGAEFLVSGILDEGAERLPAGSGAVLVGGGGTYGRDITQATDATRDLDLSWVVGEQDGAGATEVGGWSALDETTRAADEFAQAGYGDATHHVVGGDHRSYDIPALVSQGLDDLAR